MLCDRCVCQEGKKILPVILRGIQQVALLSTFYITQQRYLTFLIKAQMSRVILLDTHPLSAVTHPLGSRGRLFTIALILLGVVNIGYIINRFTEAIIEGYFQQGIRLQQQRRLMESLSEHYIICGFSRTGRQIAKEFRAEGVPFVVIDSEIESVQRAQT